MLPLIAVIIVGIAGAATFSLAELVIFSMRDARVRTLREEGYRGSGALSRLQAEPERPQVVLRAAGAICAAAVAAVAGHLAGSAWGGPGLALAVAASAFALLVLVQLVPARLASDHGVRLALTLSPLVLRLATLVGPLLGPLTRLIPPSPVREENGNGYTAKEIQQLTELGHDEGVLEAEEAQLVDRAFRLDETRAWDVMTPRVDIFAWRDALALRDIATELTQVPYSRVPVFGESMDDITGVLFVRDAYQRLLAGDTDVLLRDLAREPLIVPGSISLTRLLRDFQAGRVHVALVVDEYGGTDGLVTLEDILEELVGEIEDETDVKKVSIIRLSRDEILAAGDADLRDINRIFGSELPQDEHRSLNGYLLAELGHVPGRGEEVHADGLRVQVLEASDTQVLRARVARAAVATHAASAPARTARRSGERRAAGAETVQSAARAAANPDAAEGAAG